MGIEETLRGVGGLVSKRLGRDRRAAVNIRVCVGLLCGSVAALITLPAGSAFAAWSDPATLASSSRSQSGGNPSTGATLGQPEQAVLDDGTSVVGWILDSPDTGIATLQARTLSRTGGAPGSVVNVASIQPPSQIWGFRAVSAGSGALFFWIESSTSGSTTTYTLQSRTLSPSGALGGQTQVDSVSVNQAEGRIRTMGLSASSFEGVSNVAWAYSSAQGPASSNCGSGGVYSTQPNTSCTYVRKVRFARLNAVGEVTVPVKDVYSQQFAQNRGISCESNTLFPSIQTVSSTGEGSVVIDDGCVLLSGEPERGTQFSRIAADGSTTPVELLRLRSSRSVTSSSDGSTIVSFGDRVVRIPKTGQAVGPTLAVNESGSGAEDFEAQVAGLPNGEALATWSSRRAAGANLVLSAWARLVQADGTLGDPTEVYSKTVPAPTAQGPTQFNSLDIDTAAGQGRDTGTMLIQAYSFVRPSASSSSQSLEVMAMGINRQGKKVGGSESRLLTDSVSFDPSANSFEYVNSSSSLEVAVDGTASAALLSSKYQSGQSTFTDQYSLAGSKLVREANSCGVTPRLCKANLKVQKLTLTPKRLRAGKKATLSITIQNRGDAIAKRAVVRISSSNKQVKVPKKVIFADIADGSRSSKKVNLRVKGGGTKGKITVKVGGSTKRISFKIR